MIHYNRLMALEPTKLGEMINSKNQIIEFFEHPIHGDEASVIAVCRTLELASSTGFYELDDMKAAHGEYEPLFSDGKFFLGEFAYGTI